MESIPWVRCASGNVFWTFLNMWTIFRRQRWERSCCRCKRWGEQGGLHRPPARHDEGLSSFSSFFFIKKNNEAGEPGHDLRASRLPCCPCCRRHQLPCHSEYLSSLLDRCGWIFRRKGCWRGWSPGRTWSGGRPSSSPTKVTLSGWSHNPRFLIYVCLSVITRQRRM